MPLGGIFLESYSLVEKQELADKDLRVLVNLCPFPKVMYGCNLQVVIRIRLLVQGAAWTSCD